MSIGKSQSQENYGQTLGKIQSNGTAVLCAA